MIKLLEILLKKYATEERIHFSWDAASWHASKKLYQRIEEINHPPNNIIRNTQLLNLPLYLRLPNF